MNTLHALEESGSLQLCGFLALGSCTTVCVQLHVIKVPHHLTYLGRKGACRWVLAQLCLLLEPLDVTHQCNKTVCTIICAFACVCNIHRQQESFLRASNSLSFSASLCFVCCFLHTMIFHAFSQISVAFSKHSPAPGNFRPKANTLDQARLSWKSGYVRKHIFTAIPINYFHDAAFKTCEFFLQDTWVILECKVGPPTQNVFPWKLCAEAQASKGNQ